MSRPVHPRLQVLEDRAVPATYLVTNAADAGPGSFRQAVAGANANPGPDTVLFRSAPLPAVVLASPVAVTDDVTIAAPGETSQTVSGGGTTRVLTVAAGVSATLKNMTVSNGSVPAGTGGGILNAGSLTLMDSRVTGNKAQRGAGIENSGTLTLLRSAVENNTATLDGAGFHTAPGGSAAVTNSRVRNNAALADGAGIRSEGNTTLTITNSVVSGNTASGFGTGGLASGGALTIRNSQVLGNTSAAAGIYLMPATTTVLISKSTIANNGPSATSGSGVGGIWSFAFGGTIRIEDTVIRDNAGNIAGGFYGAGAVEIVRSTVSGNTGGGGISAFGDLKVIESTVSGNSGRTVGGINSGYTLELTRSTVSGNTAAAAGDNAAGGVRTFGTAVIQNSTVSGNTVLAAGMQVSPYSYYSGAAGGVLAIVPGLTIENSTVAFNSVLDAPTAVSQVSGGVAALAFSFTGYYGGTYSFSADVHARNTIIGRNTAGTRDPDVTGPFVSGGHNLVGVVTAGATGFVGSDLTGTAAVPLDPRLRPLKNNGGPTKTHALRPDSPAIDAGDNAGAPATDQRGRARIAHGTIDIGAYEFASPGGEGDGGGDDGFGEGMLAQPPSGGEGQITAARWQAAVRAETTALAAALADTQTPGTVRRTDPGPISSLFVELATGGLRLADEAG